MTATSSRAPLATLPRVRIAILDDYLDSARTLADWTAIEAKADVTVFRKPLPPGREAIPLLMPFDILCTMRERTPLPGEVLEGLPNLKAIAITGRRFRTLDMATAERLGIVVVGTDAGGDGQYATAELTWGLILSLLRRIPQEAESMRAGGWQTGLGSALMGKTLGIIGLGRLGARVARVARAFDMEVLAWSPNLDVPRAEAAGARYATKETLLRTADVVTLHMVLGERSRGILGAEDLALMKPTACLVNTSRGPLVDEAALIDVLEKGGIAGAALDVFNQEPLPSDHPLRRLPSVLLTPHIGYTVRETFTQFHQQTVENVAALLAGTPIRQISPPA